MCRKIVDGPLKEYRPLPGKGPIERLKEHDYDLSHLKLVVLSHQHFDREYQGRLKGNALTLGSD
jgi:hypothetical protein